MTARATSRARARLRPTRYGAEVTPLTATTLASLPAHEWAADWGDTERRFVLAEHGRWLYRVRVRPPLPLNVGVLESIRIG